MLSLSHDAQTQLNRFLHQFFQVQSNLTYPQPEQLRNEAFQRALYEGAFKDDGIEYAPPLRYQLRVLKELVHRIENSINDWDEEGVSDDLMDLLATLLASPIPSEVASAQQKAYVTYAFPTWNFDIKDQEEKEEKQVKPQTVQTITLLESPTLLAEAGNTGLRTWEAALHLSTYLASTPAGRALVRGRSILELGAGTGIVSILCARHLGARYVWATDGSGDVMAPLATNFFLNGLQHSRAIDAMQYRWGHAFFPTGEDSRDGLIDDVDGVQEGKGEPPQKSAAEKETADKIDLVLAADVTYDARVIPALVGTLSEFADLYPGLKALIAATVRNKDTFQTFLDGCEKAGLTTNMINFPVIPRDEQVGPFYSDTTPIVICEISR